MECGHNEEIFRQRLLVVQPFYEEEIELQLHTNVMRSINAYEQRTNRFLNSKEFFFFM